jgi:hypothetical protein
MTRDIESFYLVTSLLSSYYGRVWIDSFERVIGLHLRVIRCPFPMIWHSSVEVAHRLSHSKESPPWSLRTANLNLEWCCCSRGCQYYSQSLSLRDLSFLWLDRYETVVSRRFVFLLSILLLGSFENWCLISTITSPVLIERRERWNRFTSLRFPH